jgi:hypothetical protein
LAARSSALTASLGQRPAGLLRIAIAGQADGLDDERLGCRAPRLIDGVAALRLANSLDGRWRAGAGPPAGGVSQV